MRILIASSFPEAANRNVTIVDDLAEGFRELEQEHEVKVTRFGAVKDLIFKSKPDVLILIGSAISSAANYRSVSRACRRSETVFVYWTVEDPYEFDLNYKFCEFADIVFSNDAWSTRFYERPVFHLPTAAASRLWRDITDMGSRDLDVFFCGVAFNNRRTFVQDALHTLEQYRSLIIGENWPCHPGSVFVNRKVSVEDLPAYYAASRCVLNLGRNFFLANGRRQLSAVTPGPRTFEAAMVGCVQLYHKPSQLLSQYYKPNDEILVFETIDEFSYKLKALLEDPSKAERIAKAAQSRTLMQHSYAARAQSILRRVANPAAPADPWSLDNFDY